MTTLRALLVDDERLARAELRRLLKAASRRWRSSARRPAPPRRWRRSRRCEPDLLLLDVQMPGGSGFDLLAALDEAPEVIFCTAYDQYALQAFEVSALDYLQKPVQAQRLATALAARRRTRAGAAGGIGTAQDLYQGRRALLVRGAGRHRAVRVGRQLRARAFRRRSSR